MFSKHAFYRLNGNDSVRERLDSQSRRGPHFVYCTYINQTDEDRTTVVPSLPANKEAIRRQRRIDPLSGEKDRGRVAERSGIFYRKKSGHLARTKTTAVAGSSKEGVGFFLPVFGEPVTEPVDRRHANTPTHRFIMRTRSFHRGVWFEGLLPR